MPHVLQRVTVIRLDLHVRPYYIHFAQSPNPSDYHRRIRFCEDAIRRLEDSDGQVNDSWTSEETHYFAYRVLWIGRKSDIGQLQTFVYLMKDLFTLKKLQ